MLKLLYTVYDCKTLIYSPPFAHINDAEATRTLTDTLEDPNTMLHKHPMDYALYRLGTFNDGTGEFDLHNRPMLVCSIAPDRSLIIGATTNEVSNDTLVQPSTTDRNPS